MSAGILYTAPPQSLTSGGSSTKAVADPSTHTATGDRMVWDGTNWVDFEPEDQVRGFLAQNGDPKYASVTTTSVNQVSFAMKVLVPYNISVTNICAIVATAGTALTSGQNLVTLYNQAGTLLGSSADQTTAWGTAGYYVMPLSGGPYAVSGGPGSYCWVSILSNAGTTPASFRCYTASLVGANAGGAAGLTGASVFFGRIGTSITAPATFTPSSLSVASGITAWVGLS